MNPFAHQQPSTLPLGWGSIQLRYASTCLDGQRIPLNVEQRTGRQGKYPYWGANGIVDYIDEYLFDEPLVLLGEDGAPFFDKTKPVAFYITEKIWVNNHIHVMRIRSDFDPRFVVHCLNVTDYGPLIEGSTRDKLTQDSMGSIKLPVPPLFQQQRIADYLDRETSRIGALIGAMELLLKLLSEKRRAFITRAVTRGLDPDVPLRESGIPWLGEMPAHWQTERARWLFRERDKRSDTGDEELLTVSHITGVTPRSEKDVNMFEAETKEGYKICHKDDLVINTMWAWMGAMGISPLYGIVSPGYNVYEQQGQYDPAYVDALVRLPIFAQEVTRYSKGVWSSRLRLYPEGFFEVYFPVPPIEEQIEIMDSITVETKRIDSLIMETDQTISLLTERRASLIAAAVTGQIDVGGTA